MEQLNLRKYARCEWKCIAFIGTDDWGKFCDEVIRRDAIYRVSATTKPVPINAMHCSGQRGEYLIGNDSRRPKNCHRVFANGKDLVFELCIIQRAKFKAFNRSLRQRGGQKIISPQINTE